jgi:Arf-GAP/coiled-coil/ANK repeat/PH domain-containing protein
MSDDNESTESAPNSPAVPYKGEKKAWKHQLLDMEEVLTETPMFTERMKVVEQDVDELGLRLRRIVKICKDTQKASTTLNDLNRQLGDEFLDFAKQLTDDETKDGLLKFGAAIKEVGSFREMLNLQLENLILQPMETFCKEEIDEVKEKKKKYVRSSSSLESALSKAAQIKRAPTMKTLEVEHELAEARKEFQISGMDLVFSLNEIEAKKTI